MRYRTAEEILSTKPEDRVVEVFIETFGPVIGVPLALEFSTNPEYKERYEKMLKVERDHIEEIREMVQQCRAKPKTTRWPFLTWITRWRGTPSR